MAEAIVDMMEGEGLLWWPSIRAVEKGLAEGGVGTGRGTVHRALKLLKSIFREDYEERGGALAPRLHPGLRHAGDQGIVRHRPPRLGWYLDVQEEERKKQIGLLSMSKISLLSSVDNHAKETATTVGRITGNRFIRWLSRRDPDTEQMLRRLEEDPEGPFREMRPVPGAPSFFELLRTPIGKWAARWRGVKYTEKDVNSVERKWRRIFEERDRRKDL